MKKLDPLTRCIYIFPIKNKSAKSFLQDFPSIYASVPLDLCHHFPQPKIASSEGQLHRAAGRNATPGRPHRQRAVACPSKIRRAHRKSLARHCAKSCWCRWVHAARALPWPEDSAKRRIFLLVDKFWYPAKSEEVASSLVPSLLINHCNSSSWLLPSWLVDLSFQSCCAFLFMNNESSFPATSLRYLNAKAPKARLVVARMTRPGASCSLAVSASVT